MKTLFLSCLLFLSGFLSGYAQERLNNVLQVSRTLELYDGEVSDHPKYAASSFKSPVAGQDGLTYTEWEKIDDASWGASVWEALQLFGETGERGL